MPAPEFDTAHHKLDRAERHATEMAEIWNEYLEPHPFDFQLLRRRTGEWVGTVVQSEPLPPALSIVFGEWLFNLRSALDSLLWATAVHASRSEPPPGESLLQYPIYDNADAWKSNLRRLAPLSEHHREMLHTMQPFNSEDPDANYLGWINRLARIDRHRRATVATARIAVLEPVVQVRPKRAISLEWGDRVLQGGYCDLFRARADDPAVELSVNPRLGIDPEIEEWAASPFWSRIRFSERLRMLMIFVGAEVDIYEYDCTGASRGPGFASEQFKRESDERRSRESRADITRPTRPPTQWKPAGSGAPSTGARFEGRDFPVNGSHSPSAARQ